MNEMQRKPRVLLVEDNPGDIRLFTEAMKELGSMTEILTLMDPSESDDIDELCVKFNGNKPDVIVLDLNLPGKSGHEILAELKSSARLRKVPVVILTSSNNPDDIRKAYDSSANCYVVKPSELDDFFRVVQSIEHFWLQTAALPSD